jgi:hypothetical protein
MVLFPAFIPSAFISLQTQPPRDVLLKDGMSEHQKLLDDLTTSKEKVVQLEGVVKKLGGEKGEERVWRGEDGGRGGKK